MQGTVLSTQLKLAIVGAALAVSGVAMAAGAGGPERFHDRAGHPHHHGQYGFHTQQGHEFQRCDKGMRGHRHAHMQRAGLIVPGYGVVSRDFVDGMGLNEEQQKLLDEARTAAKELRENRREHTKAQREARFNLFKADTLNPQQALKQREEYRDKLHAERREVEQKWLAVWNSLDAGQQARVADHLKQRAEKAQERIKRMEEHKAQRDAAKSERAAVNSGSDTRA